MGDRAMMDVSTGGADPELERAARIAARVAPSPFAWLALVEGETVKRWGSAGCRVEPIARGEHLISTCWPSPTALGSPSPAPVTLEISLRQPSVSPYHRAVPLGERETHRAGVVCVGDWQARRWAPEMGSLLEDVASLVVAGVALLDLRDERCALEARLQQAAQLKERLASTLRHEFGQPLTVIQGFSELMSGEGLTPEEIREYAEEINREACRLAEIVARIRNLDELVDAPGTGRRARE